MLLTTAEHDDVVPNDIGGEFKLRMVSARTTACRWYRMKKRSRTTSNAQGARDANEASRQSARIRNHEDLCAALGSSVNSCFESVSARFAASRRWENVDMEWLGRTQMLRQGTVVSSLGNVCGRTRKASDQNGAFHSTVRFAGCCESAFLMLLSEILCNLDPESRHTASLRH